MPDVSGFVNNILQASAAMIALSMTVLSVFAAYKDKNIDIARETFNKVIWYMITISATLFWSLGTLLVNSLYPGKKIMTQHAFLVGSITAGLFSISAIFLVYFILKNYNLVRKF